MFISHNQLRMYGFSNIVNLLSNSPGTALHCYAERSHTSPVKHKSWHSTKELKASEKDDSANVFFLTFAFVNTIRYV